MMRTTLFSIAIVLTFASVAPAETVKVADARKDTAQESDGFVLFISKRFGEGTPVGDAIVAAAKGEAPDNIEIEAAFGMYYDNGQAKSGKVPPEIIEALRASEEGQPTMTFIARVNEDMYDSLLGRIKEWENGENVTPAAPPSQVLEAARILLLQIEELKLPYASGFTPNSQLYFEDLHVLNRDE